MRADLVHGRLLAGLQHHHSVHTFTPIRVGHTDYRACCHRRMAGQRILYLGGVHVLTAGDDHVLDPIDDEDVAVLVHPAAVAGVHPPVTDRCGGVVGAVPVAEHHVVAARDDLADLAAWYLVAVGIDDADLDVRRRATRRPA